MAQWRYAPASLRRSPDSYFGSATPLVNTGYSRNTLRLKDNCVHLPMNTTIPVEIASIVLPFAALFTKPVWGHAQTLLMAAILTTLKRTITYERLPETSETFIYRSDDTYYGSTTRIIFDPLQLLKYPLNFSLSLLS